VESLLGGAEVSALDTSVPVQRAVTFDPTVGSPSTFLQEFPDAVFHALDVKLLLGEAEVSAL